MEIKINFVKCQRCKHEWVPRKKKVFVCPKCHSFKWNEKKAESRARHG